LSGKGKDVGEGKKIRGGEGDFEADGFFVKNWEEAADNNHTQIPLLEKGVVSKIEHRRTGKRHCAVGFKMKRKKRYFFSQRLVPRDSGCKEMGGRGKKRPRKKVGYNQRRKKGWGEVD